MVLQKRLDYGSNGYQVPAMPHVPRSARGKRSVRKKAEDNRMCAFDLLATVAGRLLSERQNSPTPCNITGTSNCIAGKDIIKQEQFENEQPLKAEAFDQGSCDESALGSEIVFQRQSSYASKEHPQTPYATASSPASAFVKSDKKDSFAGESNISSTQAERRCSLGTNTIPKKCGAQRCIPGSMESYEYEGDGIKTPHQAEWRISGKAMEGNAPDMNSSEDPMDWDAKPPALVSSDSSAEVPSCRDRVPHDSSVPKCGNGMEFSVYGDDDENSSGCTHPSPVTTHACRAQRIGNRRIRKLLTSKYWKVDPTMSKDGELANTDIEMKPVLRSRRMPCTRQRTQRSSFKRRKLFDRCSISASDGGIFRDGISNPPGKSGIKLEASDAPATLHGGNGASSSTTGQKLSYESGDYHVKLSIKSFKVPELFIEIPENATVGSLKRTVLEAVTAILGGGLRVGILLQGKKVRDDCKTLHQAGIAHAEKLDNLGFTLEPNPRQAPAPLSSPKDSHLLHPGDAAEPLERITPAKPSPYQGASDAAPQPILLTSAANCPESDHDSVHSPADAPSLDKTTTNSQALVPVPQMNAEALSMVPLRKSRHSEMVQRRIRRPFSVTEVEALVQAVEKLGTGRWRDVKLRAFDNAKHRTYVDLKDKWKTLVHTAKISPQQRRGEPVPQELLDRVLSAHAYWSQQQARLQVKPPAQTFLLL